MAMPARPATPTSPKQIKAQAMRAVRYAIRKRRLTRQPCEVCGATPVHAHHDDYDKPLEVRWLCPAHHVRHHWLENIEYDVMLARVRDAMSNS